MELIIKEKELTGLEEIGERYLKGNHMMNKRWVHNRMALDMLS